MAYNTVYGRIVRFSRRAFYHVLHARPHVLRVGGAAAHMDLRRFDVYPKTHDDLKVRTLSGATISLCCYVFATVLLFQEFKQFRALETVDM